MKDEGASARTDVEIERLAARLAAWPVVRFAYLFGSRARGTAQAGSDIDLAVSFREQASAWEEVALEEILTREVGLPVQVVALDAPIPPTLLEEILATGRPLKESPGRAGWEREAQQFLGGYAVNDTEQVYLLASMEDKVRRLIRALPLLESWDLAAVQADEPEAIQDFLGAFLMVFEPLETLARRVARYAVLALGHTEESATLREQVTTMGRVLDLEAETLERLGAMARLRGRIAHAYWELAAEDLESLRPEVLRPALERLADKASRFIILQNVEPEASDEG